MSTVSYPTRDLVSADQLDQVSPLLMRGFLGAVATAALGYIRSGWPVDTAYSLSRWQASGDGERVLNDAAYASFVHEDTKNGGPPGLAERLWRQLLAGAISGEITAEVNKYSRSAPAVQGNALEIFRARRAARGESLRDAAIRAGQLPANAARTPPNVAGGAIWDPISQTGGALTAAAPSSAVAIISTAPTVVSVSARPALITLTRQLVPSVSPTVIRALQAGNVRRAAQALAALGRVDAALALVRGVRSA